MEALPTLQAQANLEAVGDEDTGELLAAMQNALPELQKEQETPGVMTASRDRTGSLLQTFVSIQAPPDGKVQSAGDGILEATFDSNDIVGWFGSFFTWWKKIVPHPWVTAKANPDPLPNTANIALLSDWGTGLYGAPVCAKSIEQAGGYDVVLHLGDVYYSGTESEIKSRFLDLWPKVPGAINRGLNGNHEMYTGGKAYFDIALKAFDQPASYFALQNDHFLVACLDTAYDEHDLHGDQAKWLTDLVAAAGDRKLVLFSHHQPYSLMDVQGPKLVEKLKNLLESKRIHAWYWGHEHHCVIYDAHPEWGLRGRCIGHSGFPEFRKKEWGDAPAAPSWRRLDATADSPGGYVLDGRNDYIQGHETEYAPHGYVTLAFAGATMTEEIHQAGGSVIALPAAQFGTAASAIA
jgi:hypothetical protein